MKQPKRGRGQSRRAIVAFLAGPPIAAALVAATILPLAIFFGDPGDDLAAILGALCGAILILSYLASCLVGIPLYLLFRRLGWQRRRHSLLLGALIGLGSGTLVVLIGLLDPATMRSQKVEFFTGVVVITVLLAATLGLLFALIIRRRRLEIRDIAATFD
jgi:hypothetical protein